MGSQKVPTSLKIVTDGIPVARPGLILGEDEATASKKLFKHLPGPPGPVFVQKMTARIEHPQKSTLMTLIDVQN